MTAPTVPPTQPISTALVDIALLNENNDAILTIDGQTHRLKLVITNLTDVDLSFGDDHGTELSVSFRPGILKDFSAVTVLTPEWSHRPGLALNSLTLVRTEAVTITPRDSLEIELGGLTASDRGGSRATRVSVEYSNAHLAGEGVVSGRRTVHLSVLHPQVAPGLVLGSVGTAGPFTARIVGSADVLNDGIEHPIQVAIGAHRLVTVQGIGRDRPNFTIPPSHDLGATVTIDGASATGSSAWAPDNGYVGYAGSGPADLNGDVLTLDLSIATDTAPGLYPLGIQFENIDGTDGTLFVLLNITTIGTATISGAPVVTTRSLEVGGGLTIRGDDGVSSRLDFGDSWFASAQPGLMWFESKLSNPSQFQISSTSSGARLEAFHAGDASNRPLSIGGTANVGIGTDDPAFKLDVQGSIGGTSLHTDPWYFAPKENDEQNWLSLRRIGSGAYSNFAFTDRLDTNLAEFFMGVPGQPANIHSRVNKLGINNRDPQHALDVNGEVNADGLKLGSWRLKPGWIVGLAAGGRITHAERGLTFHVEDNPSFAFSEEGATYHEGTSLPAGNTGLYVFAEDSVPTLDEVERALAVLEKRRAH